MKTSKHEEAVQKFLAENPMWANRGLRKTINLILEDLEDVGFDNSLGFIPDAFEIDLESRTIRLLEIEGGNRISKAKMEKLAFFAWDMDCRAWFTELHIISLITGARSKVTDDELIHKCHEIFSERAKAKRAALMQEQT
jgi:hypothetical protein